MSPVPPRTGVKVSVQMPCAGGGETGSISARTSDHRGNLNNAKPQTLRPKPFTPETLGWVPGVTVS